MLNELTAPVVSAGRFNAPAQRTPPRNETLATSDRRPADAISHTSVVDPTDAFLIKMSRTGDQSSATQLYRRYARRLTALVKRRCSHELAHAAGVEDIVQSVFKTLFNESARAITTFPMAMNCGSCCWSSR